jgi:dienelactone hydrolase
MYKTCLFAIPLLASALAMADPTTAPLDNGWKSNLLDYLRPQPLLINQSTPSADQVNFYARPRRLDPSDFSASTKTATPRTVADLDIIHLNFKDTQNDIVPALLSTPRNKPGPYPLVIAVHGLRSNKAQVTAQLGPALGKQGFALLAPDMPLHGERPGDPNSIWNPDRPLHTFELFRQAITDVRQCIDVAETLPQIDLSRGVILAGYSMGSWIDSITGPADDRVRAMVLMVGGATELGPAAILFAQVSAVDPLMAIPHFASRPLLMLSAKYDPIVTPEMSKRLFAAAGSPKKQTWYNSGHLLPATAYEDAATWIADTWSHLKPATD